MKFTLILLTLFLVVPSVVYLPMDCHSQETDNESAERQPAPITKETVQKQVDKTTEQPWEGAGPEALVTMAIFFALFGLVYWLIRRQPSSRELKKSKRNRDKIKF